MICEKFPIVQQPVAVRLIDLFEIHYGKRIGARMKPVYCNPKYECLGDGENVKLIADGLYLDKPF
jgi:hypothetical protein